MHYSVTSTQVSQTPILPQGACKFPYFQDRINTKCLRGDSAEKKEMLTVEGLVELKHREQVFKGKSDPFQLEELQKTSQRVKSKPESSQQEEREQRIHLKQLNQFLTLSLTCPYSPVSQISSICSQLLVKLKHQKGAHGSLLNIHCLHFLFLLILQILTK